MKRQIPLTLLALLAILGSMVPAALAQGPTPPPSVAPEKASEEETALDAPQHLFRAGPLAVSYVYTNSTPLAIPDVGCPNYVVSTINVPDSFSIGDLNVGVWIAHTFRGDLDMYLQGPDGTTVELYTDPDVGADNINVLFDESSPNLVADSVNHNPPPPYYYVTWNPEGNLDNFNFKNAQGTWTFMVCDDASGDTGTLNTWTLFFRTGLLLNPETQSGGACRGSDVTYTFQVVNTTGVTQSFDLSYTSAWPVSGPSSTPVMPNNSTWSFDVTVHVPWASNPYDSDTLIVTVSGGGDTAQATATTISELAWDWQDYANIPAGREVRAPSVVYYDGKLYVIGGYGFVGGSGAARPWLSIYDIANNSWSIGADMPAGRYWINCEQLFDPNDGNRPKIYCAGGYDTAARNTLYIYDIGNNSWTTGPTLPAARYDYASAKLGNRYYVIGGYTTTYEATMLVYDPATNAWSTLAPMNVARRYFHAGTIGGKIYVAGGYNPSYLSSAEVYDPTLNTWTYVASMPMPWVNGADGVKHDRFLVIAGGHPSSTSSASNGALVYDALTNTWYWLPLLDHLIYGAEGDTDGDGEFWYATGRLYEAGSWLNSPYTTKLIQCGPCEGVHDVDFSVYPPVPRHNRPATFTASAIGSPVITYEWDFGDGDYGSGQVVEHTYTYTGTFTVVMTATNCDGANQVVVSHDVQVVAAPMIVVSPETLSSVQCPDAVATQTLSICNLGSADLVFTITEVPGTLLAAAVQVTLPAGPATAPAGIAVSGGYVPRPAGTYTRQPHARIAAPPNVLLLNADDDNGYGSPIQAMLQAYGDLGTVALYDPRYQTPTLGDLLPYDVVVVWSNYTFADPTAIGNVLADYVDAGGKVIDMMFALDPSWGYQGRFRTQGYTAFTTTSYTFGTLCLGTYDPGHPIMSIPTPITNVCEYYRGTGTSLTPGSTAVAYWADNELFVGAKDNQTVVTINGYVGIYYQWTGQMADVLHNAILWLAAPAGTDIPWLSEDPTTGSVPPGECQDVTVTFDSTGLTPGDYTGTLRIDNNDILNPVVNVPVTLTVAGPPTNVDFTWNPAFPVAGEAVSFQGSANALLPVEYTWDFGDGETSSGQFVEHTYRNWGFYTVTMFATVCNFTVSATHRITVTLCQNLLEEHFEGDFPPSGWTVVNNGGNCVWQRNDQWSPARPNYAGGQGYCADADSDRCGSGTTMNTELRTPSLDLSGATAATLRYMAAYNWWASGEFASTDISTDGGSTWTILLRWAEDHSPYGPGEQVTLDLTPYAGPNVMVRFHYYAPGWDYYWEVDQVAVVACSGPPGCVPPAGSAFTWSPLSPLVGEEVAFTGTAGMATGPLTYEWAFGDGDYGSGWRVAHTYTSPGDYTVVMTVTNGCGQEVVTATLTVGTPPDIVVTPDSLSAEQCPDTVTTQTLSICNTGDFTLTWSLRELTQTFRLAGWKPVERPTTYLPEAVADLALSGEPAGASTPALGTTWSHPQAVLWDNGPLVTHQDACAGGTQDASRLQTGLGMNTLGFGHQFANGYRMSDDFTIADPGGWQIDTITFFAYQTNAPMSPSPITGVYLQIWDGPPWAGGSVVWGDLSTNRLLSSTFSGIQRDSESSPCPNSRYIFANVAQVGVWLPPGQYWLDWTTDGNPSYTGPWAPPITILGQTTTGDAYQYTTAWAPALDSGTSTQQGMPFVIEGSVVPAADVPWLSEDPTSGAVPGGGCQDVVITFDSTGLLPGDYFAGLLIESNDPDTPTLTVPVTLTVLEPVSADFTWAPTSPLIGQPVYFTATASGAEPITYTWAFGDGEYGSGQYVSHTYAAAGSYEVTLTATNVCGPVVVTHTLTVIGYPDIGVTPESLESTQCPDTLVTQPITICNAGDIALVWRLSEIPGLGVQAASPPARSGSPLARRPVVLSAAPLDGVSVPTHPPVVNAPVSLVLDDGSAETAIGIGGTWEFIWLNRFTPAPDDFPFVLNQVWVYFPSFGFVNVGDDILIAIYENTTGSFDPAPGSNWLFSYATTVQALDTWSVYTLPTPVPLYGPGDVLIGVIGLEVPGTAYFPAALDRTASQQRSWAGWWSVSPPPEPPLLPPDDVWVLIDNYYPGNWMVRGYGETLEDVPWLSAEPISGTVLPGMCQVVTVTFDSTGMAAGDYFARLLIQSNDPDEPLVSVPVTMTVNPLPEASFVYTPSAGYAPLTVTFTDTSRYAQNPTWDFGDGGTGSGAVVTHTYTTAGDFVVTLTVESPYGCGTDTYTATVHVVAPGLPIAGFESSSPDCLGETTYFTNTSQNATSYLWNFGDGITSTLENPAHTYAAAGTYTVILTATNAQGSDSVSHDVVILAAPAGADFTWTPITPTVGELVHFTGTVASGTPPFTYAWAFGDGGTGSGPNPTHVYAEAGTYTVLLTVTNACGEAYAAHDIVVVVPPCEEPSGADFTWTPITPTVGEAVTFTGAVEAGSEPLTYTWAFGDGEAGSGQVVQHTYAATGTYTVTLTVTNACGSATATHALVVIPAPPVRHYIYLPLVFKGYSSP